MLLLFLPCERLFFCGRLFFCCCLILQIFDLLCPLALTGAKFRQDSLVSNSSAAAVANVISAMVLSLDPMTPAGLEPAIPGSVGRCLIHWATGPSVHFATEETYAQRTGGEKQIGQSTMLCKFMRQRNPGTPKLVRPLPQVVWADGMCYCLPRFGQAVFICFKRFARGARTHAGVKHNKIPSRYMHNLSQRIKKR